MDTLNRCFIGIRIPHEIQVKLSEAQGVIRHRAGSDLVRWTPEPELQLVIMALGELTIATIDTVQRIIAPVFKTSRPLSLSIEGLGGSPSNLQPRFLWCGITGDTDELTRLHNALEAQLLPHLREYEAKPFQAHLNLGRLKQESEQNRTALGRAVRMSQIGLVGTLNISQIDLLRTAVTGAGPTLVPIQSYTLGA